MAQDITFAGEKLFATQAQLNQALDIDTFIFANVPGQDPTAAIDRNEGLPPVAQRVHTQAIQQKGKINDNIVVYSTVLESITGPFEFNWVGLYSSVHQTLIAVQHIPTVNKTTTVGGAAGNTLSRNFGIQYSGIAALTEITVDAQTWQLDFSARLEGVDTLHRQLAREMNGDNWFTNQNFQVFHYLSDTFKVNAGFGYVYGLRVELNNHVYLTADSYPQNVYIDAWMDGDASSTWKPQHEMVMTNQSKSNYIDENGKQHFMLKIAVVNGADDVEDLREGSVLDGNINKIAEDIDSTIKVFKTVLEYQDYKINIPVGRRILIEENNKEYNVINEEDGDIKNTYTNQSLRMSFNYQRPLAKGSGVDVFIIYGQSNAVGYANSAENYPDNIYDTKYWRHNTNQIESLERNMSYSSGNLSTGHAWQAFANEYTKATGRNCLFIPCALGGATVSELSKGGAAYTAMEDSISDFEAYAIANNIQINSRSIIYHQGESDMSSGTSHNAYIVAQDTLFNNMRSDFECDSVFLYRVGCPQNRKEESWYAIQSAQDYLAQSYEYIIMIYAGCGSFTLGNRLLREGVHYTQLGYNVMGEEGGRAVAKHFYNQSPRSVAEENQYNSLMTTPDHIWRHTYARCLFNSTTSEFELLDIDTAGYSYRAVNVLNVEIVSDKLRIHIQSRANYISDLKIDVNEVAKIYGITASVSMVSTGNNTWYFEVGFYKDLDFMISMDTGSIVAPPTASGSLPWFDELTVSSLGSNYYQVGHPTSQAFPLVSSYYHESTLEEDIKPVFLTYSDSVKFRVKTYANSAAKAICVIPNCFIPASKLIGALQVNVSAIVAAKKL